MEYLLPACLSAAPAAAATPPSSLLCTRVRGGRFCRRTVLVLAAPARGAARHVVEVRASMLDAAGLAIGGDVEAWFVVETRSHM